MGILCSLHQHVALSRIDVTLATLFAIGFTFYLDE